MAQSGNLTMAQQLQTSVASDEPDLPPTRENLEHALEALDDVVGSGEGKRLKRRARPRT